MTETITDIFFGGWRGVFHAAVIGGLAYLGFIALLHAFGKTMLMKTSAASLVVTTALGSGLASIVLVEKISLVDGIASFTTIMALQTAFIWASAHSTAFRRLVKGDPVLVYFHGRFFEALMREHGLIPSDIHAAIRSGGMSSVDEVGAVVFESNGELTAVRRSPNGAYTALKYVRDFPPEGMSTETDPLDQLPHR